MYKDRPTARKRLESILSYFSISTDSGVSSSASGSNNNSNGSSGNNAVTAALMSEEGNECTELLSLSPHQDWMQERLFSLKCLEVKSVLGQGQYGVVYKATVVDGSARYRFVFK